MTSDDKTIFDRRMELEKELEKLQEKFVLKRKTVMASLAVLRMECESQGHVSLIDPDDHGYSRCSRCGVYF